MSIFKMNYHLKCLKLLPQRLINTRNLSSQISKEDIPKVLITGGCGQLGLSLARHIRDHIGNENVLLTDIVKPNKAIIHDGPFKHSDILDQQGIEKLVVENQISWLFHLSAVLSAKGEKNVDLSIKINVDGLHNILEVAKTHNLRLFVPSTIGAFGPNSPKKNVPEVCIQDPNTIYGVTKVYAEMMGNYFHQRFGLDFRSARLPGVISGKSKPGGGTTDYAVNVFHDVANKRPTNCFLKPDTRLPMIYIDDCVQGIYQLMQTRENDLSKRVYNLNSINFTPEELFNEIRKRVPDLTVNYAPDFRQLIADTWPENLDDTAAKNDWNWTPKVDLSKLVTQMLKDVNFEKT